MPKPTTAEKIHVNSKIQGWILEYFENNPDEFKAVEAAFWRKFEQLEKETQRLINPPKPRKPKASVQFAGDTPVPEYVNPKPRTGRTGRNG